MSAYRQYLKTLRRVPDDIVLSVATREVIPSEFNACLCGWFVRESIARMTSKDASDVTDDDLPFIVSGCTETFGGDREEWNDIFVRIGADDDVERAFVKRVLEAVA